MLSNDQAIARLKEKETNLKEALHYTDLALAHDDYAKPFSFVNENSLKPEEFQEELLRAMVERTNNRKLGFDPDLAIQHIEKECLEQFNEIVTTEIKGKSIVTLMRVKHELELFMLNDRKVQHMAALEKVQKEILEIVTNVAIPAESTPSNVAPIKSAKKPVKKK